MKNQKNGLEFSRIISVVILFTIFYLLFSIFVFTQSILASQPTTVEITGTVILGCGDGVIQNNEQCDGTNLAGQTCVSQGFFGGTLHCNPNCTFNVLACTLPPPPPPPPPPPGGGGGGFIPPPVTQAIFAGRASPQSTITLLRDGQVIATTVSDALANFRITASGLSAGNYIFSVYSEDDKGIRSPLLSFPISVTYGITVEIGGIFIAPTISTDKNEVRRGDSIAVFGQSAPNSEITIMVQSEEPLFARVLADKDGIYLQNIDTSPLTIGRHSARARAAHRGEITAFSRSIDFMVGTRSVVRVAERLLKGDLNNDNRVNLIDFSIAAFWHRRTITPAFATIERERLNGDGRINLVDFSIMAFHWTG